MSTRLINWVISQKWLPRETLIYRIQEETISCCLNYAFKERKEAIEREILSINRANKFDIFLMVGISLLAVLSVIYVDVYYSSISLFLIQLYYLYKFIIRSTNIVLLKQKNFTTSSVETIKI